MTLPHMLGALGVLALAAITYFLCDLFRVAQAEAAEARDGWASWYGERYRGKPMANGQPFVPEAMTCAARDWPLGTYLLVICEQTNRSVVVQVTDVGPAERLHRTGRIIDLSHAAFAELMNPYRGVIYVRCQPTTLRPQARPEVRRWTAPQIPNPPPPPAVTGGHRR